MDLEQTLRFNVEEYISIDSGLESPRRYRLKLVGRKDDILDETISEVWPHKSADDKHHYPFPTVAPGKHTDALIHLMQTALVVAHRAYPKADLRKLKYEFTVTQHRTIVTHRDVDVTKKRKGLYQEIIKDIFSGEHPRFYEEVEDSLDKR